MIRWLLNLIGFKRKPSGKVLWLDTETTGLDPRIHGLREIGYIIEIDGAIKEKGVFYLDPFSYEKNIEISDYVEHKMGVDVDDLKQNPSSVKTFMQFCLLLDQYVDIDNKWDYFVLVGYNVKFDIDMMKAWFKDNHKADLFTNEYGSNGYFHYKTVDVFNFVYSLKLLDKLKSEGDSLESVCEHFDIDIDAHKALSDIVATRELFYKITDKHIK